MENIKFLDLIKKSYDIINGDRKRFGILFGIGTILSFLVVKDRINPISTTVYLILTFGFFIAISAIVIRIVKEVYENNEYLDDNYLLRFLEKKFISVLKVQLIHVMFIILVLILSSIPIAILIAFVGSALTRFMPLFYTVAVAIIAIPVIFLNIVVGNAVQFNLLNENSIVDSFKNSIYLIPFTDMTKVEKLKKDKIKISYLYNKKEYSIKVFALEDSMNTLIQIIRKKTKIKIG